MKIQYYSAIQRGGAKGMVLSYRGRLGLLRFFIRSGTILLHSPSHALTHPLNLELLGKHSARQEETTVSSRATEKWRCGT
jgi:hypothetical protein